MIEHDEYTVPPESREWLALAARRGPRDVGAGRDRGAALRETCVVWLAMRQRARAEGRVL